MNYIEEGGGYAGCPPPDEIENGEIEDLTDMMDAVQIKGDTTTKFISL